MMLLCQVTFRRVRKFKSYILFLEASHHLSRSIASLPHLWAWILLFFNSPQSCVLPHCLISGSNKFKYIIESIKFHDIIWTVSCRVILWFVHNLNSLGQWGEFCDKNFCFLVCEDRIVSYSVLVCWSIHKLNASWF